MKLAAIALCVFLAILLLSQPVHADGPACSEGERRVCGSNVGVCEAGRSTCKDGVWGACEGGTGPMPNEVCGNSLDDNCDGAVDEDCFPWLSLVLVGMGMLFIGIGLLYIQKGKGERMLRERVSKD